MRTFNFYIFLKTFVLKHPNLRKKIRFLRWKLKNIPIIRSGLIAFEKKYFSSCAGERYDLLNPSEANDYFESYAPILAKKSYRKVMDIGCGYGYLTKRIADNKNVEKVIGVDKIEDFRCKHPKVEYISQNLAEDTKLPSGFDVIVSSEFIEHLTEEDFRELLFKIKDSLNDDGIFIGSTPCNPTRLKVFSGSPFHLREYNENDLTNILGEYFKIVEVSAISDFCLIWEARK